MEGNARPSSLSRSPASIIASQAPVIYLIRDNPRDHDRTECHRNATNDGSFSLVGLSIEMAVRKSGYTCYVSRTEFR